MKYLISITLLLGLLPLSGCLTAEVLSPTPSALDLDTDGPTCPGLKSMTVTAGPSLSLTWGEASDNVSAGSSISYFIYLRSSATSYDLVSPTKIIVGATSTLIGSGISVGSTYTAYVACKDEAGNISPTGPTNEKSATVADGSAPAALTDLGASGSSTTSILLTWSPSDDGAGGTTASGMRYRIYASSSANVDTSSTPLTTVTGTTSYLHTGLNPFSTWYYRVVAVDETGNAASDSNEASGTTVDDTTAPVFSPNSGISLSLAGTSSLVITWGTATDNVSSTQYPQYKLYRCQGSTSCNPFTGTLVSTLSKSAVTYTDSSLASSTVYVYGIKAFDYRNNTSSNTDTLVTSTLYASSSSFYANGTLRSANGRLGQGVAIANVLGPVTGYPDLIAGAPNGSEAGSTYNYTGCVHIFAGTGDGEFATTPSQTICDPGPTASGSSTGVNFGYSVTTGDFNNDTYTDVAISNPYRNRVYIYYSELSGSNIRLTSSPAVIARTSPTGNAGFGYGLCSGDIDGSGADDLIVASALEQCSANKCGRLLIYKIGTSPFAVPSDPTDTIDPWTTAGANNDLTDLGYTANNSEQSVRSCVTGHFDPSAPSELQIVAASGEIDRTSTNVNEGALFFYRVSGPTTFNFQKALLSGVDLWTALPTTNYWGDALARRRTGTGVSDTDELLVGAPYDGSVGTQNGIVRAYSIANNGGNFDLTEVMNYTGRDDQDRNGMGTEIAVFDRDGDGKDDLMAIGSALDDGTSIPGATTLEIGDVFTFTGTGSTFPPNIVQTDFDYSSYDVHTANYFGGCLATGDLNGDGYTDMVIGAPGQQFDATNLALTSLRGAVYVYFGKVAGEIDVNQPDQAIFGPNITNTSFGASCHIMDFNGDNKKDLLVGAPFRDAGGTDRGAVYVYYGSTGSVLSSNASFTLQAPTAEQVNSAYFGSSMTSGDWDTSGHADLAISATGRNSGAANQGRVYVYFADSTTGAIRTSATPLFISPPVTQATQYFGSSMISFRTQLASAANSRDLIICSQAATAAAGFYGAGTPAAGVANHGRCWVFNGSTTAYTISGQTVSTNVADSEIRYPYNLTLETPATIYFGSAATVGDWDNDGIQDAVICAGRQTARSGPANGSSNAGVCFGFRGKSDGTGGFQNYQSYLGTTVPTGNWMFANPNPEPTTVSYFGGGSLTALIGGGVALTDINNNGRDDLIVTEMSSDNVSPSNASEGFDAGRVYFDRGDFEAQP